MFLAARRGMFGGDHPVVASWVTRVIAAGGTVTSGQRTALNNFVRTNQINGTRSLIFAFYPLLGGVSGSAVALYRGYADTDTGVSNATNTGFVSGDYSDALGLTNNGSTKRLSTGINNTWATWPDHGLFAGVSGANLVNFHTLIGASSSPNADFCTIGYRSETDRVFNALQSGGLNTLVSSGQKAAYGRWHITRGSATLMTMYRNGASVATDTGTRTAPITLAYADGLALGANAIASNAASDHLRGSLLYAGFAKHMTLAQSQSLDASISQLLTDLGRPTA